MQFNVKDIKATMFLIKYSSVRRLKFVLLERFKILRMNCFFYISFVEDSMPSQNESNKHCSISGYMLYICELLCRM